MKGLFLVIEGPDGSGKSTTIQALAELLKPNYPVHVFRQPNYYRQEIINTPIENWMRTLYYFIKDREKQYHEEIEPLLQERNIVLVDRYWYSSCAYQGAIGEQEYQTILEAHPPELPTPHATYILTAPIEILANRIQERDKQDDFENFERKDILAQVWYRYQDMQYLPEALLVDASQTLEFTLEQIRQHLNTLLVNF